MIMGSNKEERWAKGSGWSLGGVLFIKMESECSQSSFFESLGDLFNFPPLLFPILL